MADNGKTSIYTVAASVARNLGLRDAHNHIMDFIEWAFEAEIKIGSKDTFAEKTVEIDVYNKKAKIPCDLYKMLDITQGGNYIEPTSSTFRSNGTQKASTYYSDDAYIHLSSGDNGSKVLISYLGIQTDDEGYPYIETSHIDAVSAYIMWKHKAREYYAQKLPQYIYKDLEQRWYWLCGQARGNDNLPEPHELDKIGRMWNSLVPIITKNGLKNI